MRCLRRRSLRTGTVGFENDQRVTSAKLCLLPQSNLTHVPLERALSLNASFKLKEGCKLFSKNLQFFGFAFAG